MRLGVSSHLNGCTVVTLSRSTELQAPRSRDNAGEVLVTRGRGCLYLIAAHPPCQRHGFERTGRTYSIKPTLRSGRLISIPLGGFLVSAIGENRNVWYRLCFWMSFLVFFAVANCRVCDTVNYIQEYKAQRICREMTVDDVLETTMRSWDRHVERVHLGWCDQTAHGYSGGAV
jgi:hypothetical protein